MSQLIRKDTTVQKTVERLAEVLWKSGDINTPFCQAALREARIDLSGLTPAMILAAREINEQRWRANFRQTNADPNSRLRVVVPGDSEFDPLLNKKHPLAVATPEQQPEPEPQPTKSKPPKEKTTNRRAPKRATIFDKSITHVLRWMGSHGWTADEAKLVLDHFRLDLSPRTVAIQIWVGAKGRSGEYGGQADLTLDEAHELGVIAGRR